MPYTSTKQRVMQSVKDFYRFSLWKNKKGEAGGVDSNDVSVFLKKLDAWLSIALT